MNAFLRLLARFFAALTSDPTRELVWTIIALSLLGIGVGCFFAE